MLNYNFLILGVRKISHKNIFPKKFFSGEDYLTIMGLKQGEESLTLTEIFLGINRKQPFIEDPLHGEGGCVSLPLVGAVEALAAAGPGRP